MQEDSISQYQIQQAREARELEELMSELSNTMAAAGTQGPSDEKVLASLGIQMPQANKATTATLDPPIREVEDPTPTLVTPTGPPTQDGLGQDGLGIDHWIKEAQQLRERKAEADRALAPVQQKNARYEKQLEQNTLVMETLLRKVEELQSQRNDSSREQPSIDLFNGYDPLQDAELQDNPGLAQRFALLMNSVKQVNKSVAEKEKIIVERLAQIEAERKAQEERDLANNYVSKLREQYSSIKNTHPDIDDYAPGKPKGQALWAWANQPGYPSEYRDIVENPAKYSTEMVSHLLNLFKNSVNPSQTRPRQPSMADIVNTTLSGNSSPIRQTISPQDEFLTQDELRRADKILNSEQMRTDPDEANKFLAKLIKTEMRNRQTGS